MHFIKYLTWSISGVALFVLLWNHPMIYADVLDNGTRQEGLMQWKADRGTKVEMKSLIHEGIKKNSLYFVFEKYTGKNEAWPSLRRDVTQLNFIDTNGFYVILHNSLPIPQKIQIEIKDDENNAESLLYTLQPNSTRKIEILFENLEGPEDISAVSMISLYRTRPAWDQEFYLLEMGTIKSSFDDSLRGKLSLLLKTAQVIYQTAKQEKCLSALESGQIENILNTCREILADPSSLRGQADMCRSKLISLLSHMQRVEWKNSGKSPLVCWAEPTGKRLFPRESLLDFQTPINFLNITAAQGEYEDKVVRLGNMGEEPIDLLVTIESESEIAKSISLRRAGPVLARDRTLVGDALIPLDSTGAISISPGEAGEIWIRVDTKHHTCKPGTYHARLRLQSSDSPDKAKTIPIEIQILPLKLPKDSPLHVFVWDQMFESRSAVVHGLWDKARDNLLDYGVNVFSIMPGDLPWPKVNINGELIKPLDFSRFDKRIRFYRSSGRKVMFLFVVPFSQLSDVTYCLNEKIIAGSLQWKSAMNYWITAWSEHLQSLGLDPKEYALYLTDEPNEAQLDMICTFSQVIKSACPSFQIYTNSSTLSSNDAKNQELFRIINIWQPDWYTGVQANPELLPLLKRQDGLQVWTYACKMQRRCHNVNIYDYYRLFSWKALQEGLRGIGFWSYCAGHNENPWDGTTGRGAGGIVVYRENDSLIMSRRWEAFREGLEDAKLYYLLSRALQDNVSPKDKAAIRALLETDIKAGLKNPTDTSFADQWQEKAKLLLTKIALTGGN